MSLLATLVGLISSGVPLLFGLGLLAYGIYLIVITNRDTPMPNKKLYRGIGIFITVVGSVLTLLSGNSLYQEMSTRGPVANEGIQMQPIPPPQPPVPNARQPVLVRQPNNTVNLARPRQI